MRNDRLKDNEEAFNRYKIRPRVMINVAKIDLETEMFGIKVNMNCSDRIDQTRLIFQGRRLHLSALAQQLCMDSHIQMANWQHRAQQQKRTSVWDYQLLRQKLWKM